jgi:hypothetical protein
MKLIFTLFNSIWMTVFHGENPDSHGGEYEDDCLLGCCAV